MINQAFRQSVPLISLFLSQILAKAQSYINRLFFYESSAIYISYYIIADFF